VEGCVERVELSDFFFLFLNNAEESATERTLSYISSVFDTENGIITEQRMAYLDLISGLDPDGTEC
jgi:hypothetical protein